MTSPERRVEALESAIDPPSDELCTIVVYGDNPAKQGCLKGFALTKDGKGSPAECKSCTIPESKRIHIFVEYV